ncbi:coniferyl aldehyde dehydrogenase [Paraferrimonas haliotis]|uniref:coniferyl aldehyde dehydrogenase n=1 Tax=Paraferrimonas haliotis TaxID=2013866 RepID=UPI000BA8F7B7|nr:coniferyl aldehyde dehydrogenase [Paraferrimonas haliotis]
MNQTATPLPLSINDQLAGLLNAQKKAFLAKPYPSLEQRVADLDRFKTSFSKYQAQLISAMSDDFGHRANNDSVLGDILPTFGCLKYTKKRLKSWMKPQKRHSGLLLAPASVRVEYQPLGVVGIIVPWNFPIMLGLVPMITALAAGNRVMLKQSEFTPKTNAVIKQCLAEVFDETQVVVIEGEADVAAAFSQLPFDHMLFTGSTEVGKHVMRAAANNLTPVTLELGGKSPAIIAPDIDLETAVKRLIFGKCMNSGQICVSPDYVLIPKEKVQMFIDLYCRKFRAMYPDFLNNKDYTHVVNERQFSRIQSWLDDARQKGASITPAIADGIDVERRKMATQLITQVSDDMTLAQQEIFGPILPIIPYDSLEQAIKYIQDRPRPLALYIMSFDKQTQQQIIQRTHSGGVAINDTVMQVAAEDAPFGGVGPSGMGHYHGIEGFKTFSKAKTVFSQGKIYTAGLVQPPYKGLVQSLIKKLFVR